MLSMLFATRNHALTPLLLAGLAAQTAPELQWQTDFTAARQLAAERHAPLFVSFRCER